MLMRKAEVRWMEALYLNILNEEYIKWFKYKRYKRIYSKKSPSHPSPSYPVSHFKGN